jgi:hypothetical protein
MLRELKLGLGFVGTGLGQLFKAESSMDNLKQSTVATGRTLDTLKGKADQAGAALRYSFGQAKQAIGGALDVLKKYQMEITLLAGLGAAAIFSSVGAAGDANESLNKFQVIFKDTWKQNIAWAEQFGDQVKRSKWDLMDWQAGFGSVFTSMGYAETQAADLSKQMTVLGVDLGSLYNVKTAEAMERLQSALVGNYEATRSLNIIMTEDDVKMFAWRKGIAATGKELNTLQKVQARMGLMMERGKVATGDATNTWNSYNNQLVAFQSNARDISIALGQQFLPKFNQGLLMANKFLEVFKKGNMKQVAWFIGIGTAIFGVAAALAAVNSALPFIKAFFFNPKMLLIAGAIVAIALVVEDLWTALNGGKAVLSPVVNWFKKYGEVIKWVGAAIGIFFAPALIMGAVGPILSLGKAIGFFGWALKFQWLTSIWPAISSVLAFSAALWTCPITWIVAGIIAVGVGIYLLWKNWDKINAAIKKTPDWIIGVIGAFNPLIGTILFVIKHFEQLKQIWNDITAGKWGKAWFDTKGMFGFNKKGQQKPGENNLKGLQQDATVDANASTNLSTNIQNTRTVTSKNTKIDKIDIKVDGSKDPKQTAKVVRKELQTYFGEQRTATVGAK